MDSSEFATKIRSKYPGAYDKLSDEDLTSKIIDKYPQYKDMIGEPSPAKTMLNGMDQMTHAQKIDLVSKSNKEYGENIKNSVENFLTGMKPLVNPYEARNIKVPGIETATKAMDVASGEIAESTETSLTRAGIKGPEFSGLPLPGPYKIPSGSASEYLSSLFAMATGPGAVSAVLDKSPKTLGDVGMLYAQGLGLQAAEAKILEMTKDSKLFNTPIEYLWNKLKYRINAKYPGLVPSGTGFLKLNTDLVPLSPSELDQAVSEGRISLKDAMQSSPAIRAREMRIRNVIIGSEARADPIETLKAVTPPEQWSAQNERFTAGSKAISDKYQEVSGSPIPQDKLTPILKSAAENEARLRAGIKPIIRSSPQEHSSQFPDFVGNKQKPLELHPFGGADEPQSAPEPRRPPITPEETAHTVLQAEIMAPGSSTTVQSFPRLYTAITGISHVPEGVASRLGAMQGVINSSIGAPPNTPITPQSFHKAMSSGKINFIEADEIDKQIFGIEAKYSGIPDNLHGPLYNDSKAAAAKPIESLVVQHLEETLKKGVSGAGGIQPPASPAPELHEMTKEEFTKEAQQVSGGAITPELAEQVHKDVIERAMEEGQIPKVQPETQPVSGEKPPATVDQSLGLFRQPTSLQPGESARISLTGQRNLPFLNNIAEIAQKVNAPNSIPDILSEESKLLKSEWSHLPGKFESMSETDILRSAVQRSNNNIGILTGGLKDMDMSTMPPNGLKSVYNSLLRDFIRLHHATGQTTMDNEIYNLMSQMAQRIAEPSETVPAPIPQQIQYEPSSTGWQIEKESGRSGIVASRGDDIVVKTASGKFKAYNEEKLVGEFEDIKDAQQAIDQSVGIKQPTAEEIESEKQMQEQSAREEMEQFGKTPTMDFARKMGISKASAAEYRGELENIKGRGIVKAKGGMTVGELAESMWEKHLIPENDIDMMFEALDKEARLGPKSQITPESFRPSSGSMEQAAKGTFASSMPEPARLTQQYLMPIQSPELFKMTKELIGKFPSLSGRMTTKLGVFTIKAGEPDIKLRLDIAENPEQAMKTLAHELGHAWQWMAEKTSDSKTIPGNLMAMKTSIEEIIGLNKALKQELINFSEYWRPYDKDSAPLSFVKYRNSNDEVISDAMSALLTSPGELQRMAPTAFNRIMENIDVNPKFHDAFMRIQGMLNGDSDEVLKARDSDVTEMFKSGRDIETEALAKRAASNAGDWKMRLFQQHDNKYYPWLKLQEDAMRAGKPVEPFKDLRHVFETSEYRNRNNYVLADDIRSKVYAPLIAQGLDESDLGKYMLYNWIIKGRKVIEIVTDSSTDEVHEFERTIFNPLGHTPETAQQGLDFMRKSLGEEKYQTVVRASEALHDLGFPTIQRMHDAGMISDEMYPRLVENRRNYATFAVQKYLEENPNISATIKAMKGTVQEIENPAAAYIKKIMAQNQAVESQLAKKAGVEFLQKNFKDEIKPTKVVNKIERPERGKGQLKLYEKGKWVSYDIDPYLAMSFEHTDPRKMDMAISILNKIQGSIFKPLWTSLNLGFTYISSPLRYTQRTLELNPTLPIGQYLKEYMSARSEAKAYALGKPSEFVKAMIQSGELEPYLGRHEIEAMLSEDEQLQRIFKRFGLDKSTKPSPDNIFMRVFNQYAEHMRTASETATTAHKIAAKKILMQQGAQQGPELSYTIRHYVGMPSTKVRGLNAQTDEALFTFFNILKEHYRTSYQRATNPTTASGFWMRSAMFVIIPKILMRAAKEGAFGDSVKQYYDRVTDYDMMKYTVFPLGKVHGGEWGWKSLYSRFPSSDIDSIIGPLVWKLTDPKLYEGKKDPVTDLMQPILSDLPSLNPTLKMGYAYLTFLTGNAPYDFFRSRPIVSQQVMNRPGMEKYEKMLEWSINETGFSDFSSYDPSKRSTSEITLQMLPGANRLLKISDYGKTQALREAIQQTPQAADISALMQKKRDQGGKLSREDMHKLAVLRFQAKQYRLPIKQQAKREKEEATLTQ